MSRINFGTDGWRGVIAGDFTVEGVRKTAQAVMSYLKGEGVERPEVVIGYDTRFMSEYAAKAASEVVCGNGGRAVLSEGPAGTPVLSYAVASRKAAGGLMITASHNPFYYNGVKFKAAYGGSALPEMTDSIESYLDAPVAKGGGGAVLRADLAGPYVKRVRELFEFGRIKDAGLSFAFDCMHGASGAYVRRAFEDTGIEPVIIREKRDPFFGGSAPEPSDANLAALQSEVINSRLAAGFALDGDADRLGVVDETGAYVMPYEVMGLVLLHLVKRRGLKGAVVKTVSTSSLIDRIAAGLGLPVRETPVGFRHICGHLLGGGVLLAGEENGGLCFAGHIPERDGLISALMVFETMAEEVKPLGALIEGMRAKYGRVYHRREDLRIGSRERARLNGGLAEKARAVYGAYGIGEIRETDGTKLCLSDGSWVLLRLSGTEPLLRIYAEAGDPVTLDRLLASGKEAFLV